MILDDDDDMGSLFPYLVKTEGEFGLLDKHVEVAVRILNAPPFSKREMGE